nr:defective in fruiting DifB [Myxococcus xanthus DZF1]
MLALPEVTEEFPWGHRTAKVKGKMFAILVLDNDGLGVTTKLPESNEAALTLPFTAPTGYGLGKSGWVSSHFKPGSEVPIGLLAQWIHESFRAVAPQKVLKALMAPGAAQAPKAKPAARKAKSAARKAKPAAKPAAPARTSAAAKPGAGAGKGGAAKRGVAAGRAVARTSAAGKKPASGKAAVGGKKSVAKPASAREGPTRRAGAKQTSTAKRGAAGSSRSKR